MKTYRTIAGMILIIPMTYSRCWKFAVLLTALLIFASCTKDNVPSGGREIVSIPTPIPEARVSPAENRWVRILFREIDGRLEGTDIAPLRETELLPGEMEARIWVGFDLYPLNGIILRQNGKSTGSYVIPIKLSSSSKPIEALREPKSGWKALWRKLGELEFYTLPDSEDIGATNGGTDAKGAVIEIKTKELYRTYMYGGIKTPEGHESKRVAEICRLLSREFGIDLFDGPKRVGIRDSE